MGTEFGGRCFCTTCRQTVASISTTMPRSCLVFESLNKLALSASLFKTYVSRGMIGRTPTSRGSEEGKGGLRRRKYVGRSGTAEGRARVQASREAALLYLSLVPEVAEAVGNAGARGAGHRSPFAEGENEATFFRGSGPRSPGSAAGKEWDSNFGEGLGSQVMVPT